jgi:ElaB/YqjD/DUF883 family membrane-anchored ribosome-binding protein
MRYHNPVFGELNMNMLIIVVVILGALVLFTLVQKLIKWMLIFATLLVLTLAGGYLFLSGDGSMTEGYLPDEVQQEVNTLRDNTNQAIQQKANETKEKAMNKANQITEEATNKMKEGIEKAVDESKHSIEKSVKEALSGTEPTPEENSEAEPVTTKE